MCATCGCSQPDEPYKVMLPGEEEESVETKTHSHNHDHPHNHEHNHEHNHDHDHPHDHEHHHHDHEHHDHEHHDHEHAHEHGHSHSHVIDLETDILQQNNLLAQRNRGYFEARNITAINLVSSPGSGKTTLLERTIRDLKDEIPIYVIEGDQQTFNDASRIKNAGAPVVQINTGTGCHLDSTMVNTAVKKLQIKDDALLMIENVGNLVCPSLFDLGESTRVVIISTTEGEDKPLKYPNMFATSDVCVINKIDLLPYVEFDVEKAKEYALRINPKLKFFEISATKGDGLHEWYQWLKQKRAYSLADPFIETE